MISHITTSSENYLEVIYDLVRSGPAHSIDVASRMGVSKASVNKAIGVLRHAGMIEQQLYGTITLTKEGESRAKEVVRRHSTIKRFLIKVLEVDEQTADEDACRMEHVVSNKTMAKWTNYLESELKKR